MSEKLTIKGGHPDPDPHTRSSPLIGHGSACQVVVIAHDPIDGTLRGEFHDPVGHGGDELVVVGSGENHLWESHDSFVERGDVLQIQPVLTASLSDAILPGKGFQECRLSGAVGADKAAAVTWIRCAAVIN